VDLVIDGVGGEAQIEAWSILKKGGKLVSLVQPPSEEQAAIVGATGAFVMGVPNNEDLSDLANMMANGDIQTGAPNIFDLDSVRQAHMMSQQGHGRGRVLLKIKSEVLE
jgi:NADPH:quinone reductase-like Zn-dependent oxidoreductase